MNDLISRRDAIEKRTQERTKTHACDCISRQAAIDAFDLPIYNITGRENAERVVEYLKAVIQRIKDLPSAEPERKKGKWISHKLENGVESIDKDVCSECGNRFCEIAETGCIWNYCPNCGARMEGES